MHINEILIYALKAFVPLGLIFIIINGSIRKYNFKKRAVLNLIIGLSLFLIFALAIFFDYFFLQSLTNGRVLYIVIPIMILTFTLVISAVLFSKAKKHNVKHMSNPFLKLIKEYERKAKSGEIINDVKIEVQVDNVYNEFVYLVYQYGNHIYLKEEEGMLLGISKKVKIRAKDTVIENFREIGVDNFVSQVMYVGKFVDENQKLVEHCYLINLSNIPNEFILNPVDKFNLDNYNIDNKNKEIILRTLMAEPFEINRK